MSLKALPCVFVMYFAIIYQMGDHGRTGEGRVGESENGRMGEKTSQ